MTSLPIDNMPAAELAIHLMTSGLQDRASYDCDRPASVGCVIALPISAAMWWGLVEAAQALGVIA